jgi:hypothetical protein
MERVIERGMPNDNECQGKMCYLKSMQTIRFAKSLTSLLKTDKGLVK